MAKKSFYDDIMNNKGDIEVNIENLDNDIKNQIKDIQESPTPEKIEKVIESVSVLESRDKIKIMNFLESKYFDLLYKNVATTFEGLNREAKLFKSMTARSFILFSQRIKIIRDEKKYYDGKYSDFKDFCEKELRLDYATAYKYIAIYETYGVALVQFEEIEYSKLLPTLTILKNENLGKTERAEFKNKFLEQIKDGASRQDITDMAKQIKEEYSLGKREIIIQPEKTYYEKQEEWQTQIPVEKKETNQEAEALFSEPVIEEKKEIVEVIETKPASTFYHELYGKLFLEGLIPETPAEFDYLCKIIDDLQKYRKAYIDG